MTIQHCFILNVTVSDAFLYCVYYTVRYTRVYLEVSRLSQ